MRSVKTITTATAGAALVLLGGLAAAARAQQQVPPRLDADSLAAQLGLSAKERTQITPQVARLNTLLARQDQMRQEHQRLWTEMRDVQQKIAGTLTPEQQRGFMLALARSRGWGPGMGYGRAGYGPMGRGPQGTMGPGAMRRGMGRGYRGYGPMGRGAMGWGRGPGGWMTGPCPMMGGGAVTDSASRGATPGTGGR